MRNSLTLLSAATALALLTGCGSSKNSTTGSTAAATNAKSSTPAASGGSAYGHGTASTAAGSTPSASGGMLITTKHGKLGTILAAGPKKLTVYLFEGDKGGVSACSGACASAWPPVTTSATPTSSAGAVSADLSTVTRSDGTKQVTYKGHPLYFFVKDKDDGDAYGQGANAFGASWYVLAPSGAKVDNS